MPPGVPLEAARTRFELISIGAVKRGWPSTCAHAENSEVFADTSVAVAVMI